MPARAAPAAEYRKRTWFSRMPLHARQKDLAALICLGLAIPAVALISCLFAGVFIRRTAATSRPVYSQVVPRGENRPPDENAFLQPLRPLPPPRRLIHAEPPERVQPVAYLVDIPEVNPNRAQVEDAEAPMPLAIEPVPQNIPVSIPAETRLTMQIPPQTRLAMQLPGPDGGPLPPPGPVPTVTVPFPGTVPPDAIRSDAERGLVSIAVYEAPLNEVLRILAQQQHLNIITAEDVTARISITVENVPFREALTQICAVGGYTWVQQGNVLLVTSIMTAGSISPYAQGREVRVFSLDYVTAMDVDAVVKGLLSQAGQSFATQSDSADPRKTREVVVVEDLPAYLARIDQYIQQIDVPPRQVLIEVHVLSIELKDDVQHGVNLAYLDSIVPQVVIETKGFAKAAAPQALLFSVTADSLSVLLEALETTTDAKTLASPKVFALDGQEARIQIGEQLGYRVTTTTQTSTLESVDFLDVGVVLTVTPQITRDNQVIMTVKPEVSSGQINPQTELPEEETTEVETTVMVLDGHGIVIAGLIQESDVETQSKVPLIGDLWLVGRLFQRHEIKRKRTEIIIALIPHIVPYPEIIRQRECDQFQRADSSLLYGPLLPTPRPFEPRFPDAGQCLPLQYKWQHLRPQPDCGAWGPRYSQAPCGTGAEQLLPGYFDAGLPRQRTAEHERMPQNGAPLPAPFPPPSP